VLSYPVVSADGAPLSPSPYLTTLRELFAEGAVNTRFDEQLDPIPADDRLVSAADARIRGMHDALEHRPALFGALCARPESASTATNIVAAVEMNGQRFHTPGFTPFEGRLQAAANIERLRRRFDARHEFSATQLEAYGECPFRFFLSQVLKIEPLAGTEVETDFGGRGTLVHALLADLHREFFVPSDSGTEVSGLPTAERVMGRFHELLAQRLGRQPGRSELHQALLHVEDRLLRDWGEAFAEQWTAYFASLPALRDTPLRPSGFEVPFGTPTHGPETAATAPLAFGAGESQVLVGGRIDRIDVGRDGDQPVYSVIDYKTGRRKTHRLEDVQAGRVLQLALYGLAVQRLDLAGPEARLFQLGYWHIREDGFAPGMKTRKQKGGDTLPPIEEAAWAALVRTLEEVVPRLAEGIRSGRFDVFNEDVNCSAFCPYSTVCRVGQIRALPDQLQKRP
jgi:ATP-dependent helicase/nuclease subunit B